MLCSFSQFAFGSKKANFQRGTRDTQISCAIDCLDDYVIFVL